MTDQNQFVLGYWAIRGLAEPSRLLLQYTKTPFTGKSYEQGDAPEYSREKWLSEKPNLGLDFPNLPYLLTGDLKITQSKAILYYLGRKFNLMGTTLKEEAHVMMLCEEAYDLRAKFAMFCYSPNAESETGRRTFVDTILSEYLKKFDTYLGKYQTKFIVGNHITVADFQVFEYIDASLYLDDEQTILNKYSNIKQFLNTIREVPELKDYIANKHSQLPLHRKDAKLGGKVIEQIELKS